MSSAHRLPLGQYGDEEVLVAFHEGGPNNERIDVGATTMDVEAVRSKRGVVVDHAWCWGTQLPMLGRELFQTVINDSLGVEDAKVIALVDHANMARPPW